MHNGDTKICIFNKNNYNTKEKNNLSHFIIDTFKLTFEIYYVTKLRISEIAL